MTLYKNMLWHAVCVLGLGLSAHADPVHLQTNALDSPLGIDTPHPVFSWQSDSKRPGWLQSAYEILIAADERKLLPGKADVWDSGRVPSSESVSIRYGGSPLHAQQRYMWIVRTWDEHGELTSSKAAWFETGLMQASEWKAQWIAASDPAADSERKAIRWIWLPGSDPHNVLSPSPVHFRYLLNVEDSFQAASLHVLVRGDFVARVNGHIAGHHKAWGAFDREEIAHLLHAGQNEIDLEVASFRPKSAAAAASCIVAASIHLTHADGREERIVTDGQWQVRANPEGEWQSAQVVGPLDLPLGLGLRGVPGPGPDRIATSASLLRKEFRMDRAVASARLSITALGAYCVSINGREIAPQNLLSPGWTDFHKRVLYETFDVTSNIRRGENAIGVLLGGGWYSSPITWAGYRFTPGPDLLKAQIDLTFDDGTRQTIGTDGSWLTADSPIGFSEIYGGESYDARRMKKRWSEPDFDAAGWRAAIVSEPLDHIAITAQPGLPIHNDIVLHPVHLDTASAAHPAVFDMGQNMVGNVRIHVRGDRGTIVRLRYAERLNSDGSIDTGNLRNADATDTYVLSGEGEETWSPVFTFHGFRYVEFSYLNATQAPAPTLATIEGLVFNSLPAEPSIRLSSSSDLLNAMSKLGVWGQRGNFVSIATDCPQRDERLGWMGDAGVFWRTGTYNFDIDAFTQKFMTDIQDAQTPAGAFTDVSPNVLGDHPGAPGWGDAGVLIPYAAWVQYGDRDLMERAFPAMERWMDFILQNNPDYLRKNALGSNYADWLALDKATPKDLIGTAYWALVARDMAEMAAALHHSADAKRYRQLYNDIANAYREAFVKDDGSVAGDSQTAYAATLFTGIAPDALRANMADRLTRDIQKHGDHLSTGFLGTPFLMFVLDEEGRSDIAFKLLLSDTYPSWGYMVKKGATTWWERWNGDADDSSMNSYNHYAFGSVMAWVYRRVAGIDTDVAGAGYHHLVIHPHFNAALPQLHVEYDSVYGTVISDWQQAAHRFTVTIPANTTATVALPSGATREITAGSHSFSVN